jgi:hypothetical protein
MSLERLARRPLADQPADLLIHLQHLEDPDPAHDPDPVALLAPVGREQGDR